MPTARTVASAANANEAIIALVEYSGSGRVPLEDRSRAGAIAINQPKIKPASDGTAHSATALAYRVGEPRAYTVDPLWAFATGSFRALNLAKPSDLWSRL